MLEDALPVGDLERLVLALQEELVPDELFPELKTLIVELNGLQATSLSLSTAMAY